MSMEKTYTGFQRPNIRLTEAMHPEFVALRASRVTPVVTALHRFDKAHTVMLTEEGIVGRETGAAILRALRKLEAAGVETTRAGLGGELHSGETYLIREIGEALGGQVNLGRSSGDLSTVGFNIKQRDSLLSLMRAINATRRVLLAEADRHAELVMPGYTFLQHAQPVTLGHTFAAWAATLARDFERAHGAYGRVNRSPAGAAIMTGSDFPLNRQRTCELLGFDSVHENTQDAISELTPDDMLDAFAAVVILHSNLARWSEDLTLWTTSEFAFLSVPDRFCGTSSIMSQKRNFHLPLETKGAAAAAIGGFVTSLYALKSPTGTPVQERHYGAEILWEAFEHAERGLRWLNEFLGLTRPNAALMRERAGEFWATVTDLSAALVRECGLSWRSSHQIVGIFVRKAVERGLRPRDVTSELLDEAAREYRGEPVGLSAAALRESLDPEHFVRVRTLYGGPNPEELRARTREMGETLGRHEAICTSIEGRLAASAKTLESAIDAILAGEKR